MIYWELFVVYCQIGLFSFGGGYAAMPLIQSLIVEGKGWLSMAEFADLTTIAEMTPGPIIVNSATFVGQKMAGLPGAIVCTMGCILPSVMIVLSLAYLYSRYRKMQLVKDVLGQLRPVVVAMIAGAAVSLLLMALFGTSKIAAIQWPQFKTVEALLFLLSLYLLRRHKVGPVKIIALSALLGTCIYMMI